MAEISYLGKPTLGPPKKFQLLTRAEEVVITRLRIGHTKATKSHILSRGPPTVCYHCGQTLTIDHMLLECAVQEGAVQECRDEYYTVDSLNSLFQTIPQTCIVEFLREAGFFYLIWCNLLTSTSPQYWTIRSDLSYCLENGWLICPEGRVSSLNITNPTNIQADRCTLSYIQKLVQPKWDVAVHGRDLLSWETNTGAT